MVIDLTGAPAQRQEVLPSFATARRTGAALLIPAGWLPAQESLYDGVRVIAAVGFPTGRHHSLIKATEARLAVQYGAAEILLALDDTHGENELIADIMTVCEAVSEAVPVWLYRETPIPANIMRLTGTKELPL
ncbi:hypothetical protein [Corynebacterium caspium]|uniref:hypothetical protein n=1 Tax=Corynebacterium caspium TaxID=234828 RepID=UPI000364E577|nr:hypothetical protein [Corynebacterium caspium]WKD59928.1 deoxyribose-phosphate aldolase [Corynebacterium caspium DSM 44850]